MQLSVLFCLNPFHLLKFHCSLVYKADASNLHLPPDIALKIGEKIRQLVLAVNICYFFTFAIKFSLFCNSASFFMLFDISMHFFIIDSMLLSSFFFSPNSSEQILFGEIISSSSLFSTIFLVLKF